MYQTACFIFTGLLLFCVAVIASQLSELKECRLKLENLTEMKGKYEEKSNHSLAVMKQMDGLREMMTKCEDQLAKEAHSKEDCEKNTRQLEANVREFLQNVTILARENMALEFKYKTCSEKHSTFEHELETCNDKLRTCEHKKSSSINRMETNLTPMYLTLAACVGMLIHWTCHL